MTLTLPDNFDRKVVQTQYAVCKVKQFSHNSNNDLFADKPTFFESLGKDFENWVSVHGNDRRHVLKQIATMPVPF